MTTPEKIEFIGKLVHLVQSDETSFSRAKGMILRGDVQGLFEGVTILPENYSQSNQTATID
jgi:hypothetical protein